jgi:hypothetical protein
MSALATSLVTLIASLVARLHAGARVPVTLAATLVSLTTGAMAGAWIGARHAGRLSPHKLERVVLVLLVSIGAILAIEGVTALQARGLPGGAAVHLPVAAACGLGIGVVSSLLGVAGGATPGAGVTRTAPPCGTWCSPWRGLSRSSQG